MLLALHVGFRRILKLLEALEVWLLGVKIILFRVRTADHARDCLGHLGSKLQLLDLVLAWATQLKILGIHVWAGRPLGWCWWFCMLLIRRLVELPVTLEEGSIRVFDTRRRVLLKWLWWMRLLGIFLLDVLWDSLHLGGGRLLGHHLLVHGWNRIRGLRMCGPQGKLAGSTQCNYNMGQPDWKTWCPENDRRLKPPHQRRRIPLAEAGRRRGTTKTGSAPGQVTT